MLLFVQMVADLGRELHREFVEPLGRGVDTAELLDQFLGLVVVGECVTADGQSGIVHQERHVEMALLGRGMGVEFVGEREEGGAPIVGGARAWVIVRASDRCTAWLARRSSKIVMVVTLSCALQWVRRVAMSETPVSGGFAHRCGRSGVVVRRAMIDVAPIVPASIRAPRRAPSSRHCSKPGASE